MRGEKYKLGQGWEANIYSVTIHNISVIFRDNLWCIYIYLCLCEEAHIFHSTIEMFF